MTGRLVIKFIIEPMNPKITNQDLLLFIYNELSQQREKEVKQFIESDMQTKMAYNELVSNIKTLEENWLSPSETTLKIISQKAHDGFGQMA